MYTYICIPLDFICMRNAFCNISVLSASIHSSHVKIKQMAQCRQWWKFNKENTSWYYYYYPKCNSKHDSLKSVNREYHADEHLSLLKY